MRNRSKAQLLSNGGNTYSKAGEKMAWISVHEDVIGPKLRKLSKAIKTSPAEALGILNVLWFWGLKNADETGMILCADRNDIEYAISSITRVDRTVVVDALFSTGWLDKQKNTIYIHDWDTWQEQWYKAVRRRKYDTARKALKRQAALESSNECVQSNGKSVDNEAEVPKENIQESVFGSSEEQKPAESASQKKNSYSVPFEAFWDVYPRRVEKGNAYRKYQTRRKDGYSDSELFEAAKNYAAECKRKGTEKEYIKHPATFLSDTCPFTDYLPKKPMKATEQEGNPFAEWGTENE